MSFSPESGPATLQLSDASLARWSSNLRIGPNQRAPWLMSSAIWRDGSSNLASSISRMVKRWIGRAGRLLHSWPVDPSPTGAGTIWSSAWQLMTS